MQLVNNGSSVSNQLNNILRNTLPMSKDTGKAAHLNHISVPAEGKGKVVHFTWDKRDFRVTANLKVQEHPFGFGMRKTVTNSLTDELENKFITFLKASASPVTTQEAAEMIQN
jgi:hypothetical protein